MSDKIDVEWAEKQGREWKERVEQLDQLEKETGSPERLREALYDLADEVDRVRDELPEIYARELTYEISRTHSGTPLLEVLFYKSETYFASVQRQVGTLEAVYFLYSGDIDRYLLHLGIPWPQYASEDNWSFRLDPINYLRRVIQSQIIGINRDGREEAILANRAKREAERLDALSKREQLAREEEAVVMEKWRERREVEQARLQREAAEAAPFKKAEEDRQNREFVRNYLAFMAVSVVVLAAVLFWLY